MSRALAAAGVLTLLTACVSGPYHQQRNKTINTALTGACLATQLVPCTIAASDDAKEAKAASVRAGAQQEANAVKKDAAQRSSCLTEDGPKLPVRPSQCSAYAN
jgi:hypothetical protein